MDFLRFENLRKDRGVTKAFLCSIVGRGKQYINDCMTRNTNIPAEYIKKWADALGTTPEYLNGETDEKEKPATGLPSDGLSEKKIQLINQIRDADDDTVDLLFQIADRIMHDRPEE